MKQDDDMQAGVLPENQEPVHQEDGSESSLLVGKQEDLVEPELEAEDYNNQQPVIQRDKGSLIQQIGLNMVMLGVLALLAFLAWQRFSPSEQAAPMDPGASNVVQDSNNPVFHAPTVPENISLDPYATPVVPYTSGVSRLMNLRTTIPSRPRVEVITYTVEAGDTLFSIANNYSLKPETILWGNYEVLEDNPHLLKPKQVLNILPVDGIYYQWHEGDNLTNVAQTFKTDTSAIVNYTGNNFELTEVAQGNITIDPGRWLIIPGGQRDIKDWGPPAITRQNPASARYYGEGHCGTIVEGAYGTGTFVWPTTDRSISGYHYNPPIHPAIDIGGQVGNPIYASDSGVIVYAGWSDYGYGYLVVIDHGNGWQSAYAHLSAVAVTCGQSVYQGGYIGALGSTGNSSGPHLHFELVFNGVKVNPMDYAY